MCYVALHSLCGYAGRVCECYAVLRIIPLCRVVSLCQIAVASQRNRRSVAIGIGNGAAMPLPLAATCGRNVRAGVYACGSSGCDYRRTGSASDTDPRCLPQG